MNAYLLTLLLVSCPSWSHASAGSASSTVLADEAATPAGDPSSDGGEKELPAGGEAEEEPEAGAAEFEVVTVDEAAHFLKTRSALFVDARSRQTWEMGHIPGAIDVPSSDFDKGYAAAKSRLPKDATIVVYCESSHCDQAVDVLRRLKALGYKRLLHLRQGWIIWDWSKLPQEKSDKYKKGQWAN